MIKKYNFSFRKESAILSRHRKRISRFFLIINIAIVLTMIFSFFQGIIPRTQPPEPALAHNLQTKMTYMFFDKATQAFLDARMNGTLIETPPYAGPPNPLLRIGDELGIIIKVIPKDGTTTGVGGHVDFYIPNGTTVIDAAYLVPDNSGGFIEVPMKGQSPIAIGDGPIGAKPTIPLIGMVLGPNINGVSEKTVADGTGLDRGTIAGVYGDTGIFYSTSPDTAWGSYGSSLTLTNNSGDVIVPLNKWDAEQLSAFGIKGSTNPAYPANPIIDPEDGRGNAPWGMASGVGGPQSGYAWSFDKDYWDANPSDPNRMKNSIETGPWKRIQYPGSRISFDQAGLKSSMIGYANVDGSTIGYPLSPGNPLPQTISQSDVTSPKVLRFAVGQLTEYRPEFVWVKIRVDNPGPGFLNESGCPYFRSGTFGGDAGGSDNGKDHLWRYYEPSTFVWNGCLAVGKTSSKEFVKVGETIQFNIKVYNLGTQTQTNVVASDLLPSNVQFISAAPTQNSGPNPLVWNIGTLQPGQLFSAVVTVKVTGTTYLDNCVTVTSDQGTQTACDTPTSGLFPYLVLYKTTNVTSVGPGGQILYTVRVDNIGTGSTASPVTINEYLPTGFTYDTTYTPMVTVNGANITGTAVNSSNLNQPIFTVPAAIQSGKQLLLTFRAIANTTPGTYCNVYSATQNGIPVTSGSLACVNVGAASIGDTVFSDWNGNGIQDPEDEGIAGVTIDLKNASGTVIATTTTDQDGKYLFSNLTAGTYTVVITDLGEDGLASTGDEKLTGYTQTYDPDSACPGAGCNKQTTKTLVTGEQYLNADFGFKPGGTGVIGDTLWKDDGSGGGIAGDGIQNGTEAGISGVTVFLYEDTNGNGSIDIDDALVATTTTGTNGFYQFTGLALNLNYLVKIDETDPQFTSAFGAGPISASTPKIWAVSPTSDEPTIDTADFGYYQPAPASVGDTVFQDLNGNGVYDVGIDTPLANVEVLIYEDLNGDGVIDPFDPLVGSTSTNGSGIYGFTNLPPGNYIVQVNTSDPDIPNGLAAVNNPQAVSLAPGQINNDIDFPFVALLTKGVVNITTGQNPGINASPGDILEYTVMPNYTGSNLLTDLQVFDPVPAGSLYVPGSANVGGIHDGLIPGTVNWFLGSNTEPVVGSRVYCPATTMLTAIKDTFINEQNAQRNYGRNNATDYINTANEANKDRVGLIEFNLTGLPVDSLIDQATLRLTTQGGGGDNRQVEIHSMITAWTEGTQYDANCSGTGATWLKPDCGQSATWAAGNFSTSDFNATSLGTINPTNNNVTYVVDVTNTVKDWHATPANNKGFAMWPVGSATNIVSWYNQAATTPSYRPQLFLRYLVPSSTGSCAVNTDGLAIYSVNANAPRYSSFNGTANTWSSSSNAATFANKQRYITLDYATGRVEAIATAVLDNNTVAGQVWNGSTWSVIPNPPAGASGQLGTVSIDTAYSTAVAYESKSSDALVVWDNNSLSAGNKLRYTTYDGTTWAAAASITYGGAEPLYMRLAASPLSDRVMLVVNDSLYDDYAIPWNGTSWGTALSLDTSGSAVDDRTALYAAYEAQSGRVMVAYAKNNDSKIYYRLWDGSTWTSEASVTAPAGVTSQPQWIVMATDPTSNRIALAVLTTNKTVWLRIWDGSAWPTASAVIATTGAQTKDSPTFSVVFESVSGQALAVYGEGKKVRYRTWPTASSGWTAELNGPVLQDNVNTLVLNSDPNSDEIMLTAMDSKKRVLANLWSGSAWQGSNTSLSTNTNYPTGQPFAFNWFQDSRTQPGSKVSLRTNRTFVTDTSPGSAPDVAFTLTMVVETVYAGTLTSAPLTINTTGGASASCSGPTPALPQSLSASTPLELTWSCTVGASSGLGGVTISSTPTGTGTGVGFAQATSNSIIVIPPLKFRVQVLNPNTTATINNIAYIKETGGTIPETPSNEVITYLPTYSISGHVWFDNNVNQIDDSEPDIANAVVLVYLDSNGNGILDLGEVEVGFAITDTNGNYIVSNLPPGNYLIDVYEASIDTDETFMPSTPNLLAVTLGPNAVNQDFGYFYGATIGDTVFYDVNHNGIYEPDGTDGIPGNADDETGLAGVTVCIDSNLDGSCAGETYTKVTDANGNYLFLVPPGTYTVIYDASTIPGGLTEATTPASVTLTVIAGEDRLDVDFGVDNTGKIGDRVWKDLNGNGVDNSEPGLGGVTVNLYDSTGTILLDTTVTDGNGFYQFIGLPDGTYVVKVDTTTLPAGYTQTYDNSAPLNHAGVGVVLNGGTDYSVDFGYQPVSGVYTVSGNVWHDNGAGSGIVGNGSKDGTEPGLAGITVCLYRDTNNNDKYDLGEPELACTTTDASGNYSFPGIPNGEYVVRVDTDTLPPYANIQTGDPDQAGTCTTCDSQSGVTVSGANPPAENFGYNGPSLTSSIGDRVWLDENSNGMQDAGEAGIPNVKVMLYDASENLLAITYTDTEGSYVFSNLNPGTYVIKVDPTSLPSGLAANQTYDPDAVKDNQATLVLVAGEENTTTDFGYNWSSICEVTTPGSFDCPSPAGAIGDRVWIDANGDGVQDLGEAGLGGVTVELVNLGADGQYGTSDDIVTSTFTDAAGYYIFDGIFAGAYVVRIPASPAGYSQTGDPDQPGITCTTCDHRTTAPILLSPGDVYVNADFGYKPNDNTFGIIGDTVWLDSNRNNTKDGSEPGIPGVTVALIRDTNGNGRWDAGEPIIATDITDANGTYNFSGLPIGADADFLVWVNDTNHVLAELVPVYDFDGTNPTTGMVTGLGITSVQNLAVPGSSTADTDTDFGYAPFGHNSGEGLIGDTIFLDRENFGVADPGEGLEGVTVRLYDYTTGTLIATTITNENGQYFFGSLNSNRTYVVVVDTMTLPSGLTNTFDPDGGVPNASKVTLTSGSPVNLAQDFGYQDTSNPNTISGTIWKDSDGDGTLEGTETGRFQGVTVVLRGSGGQIIATTTTDSSGNFSFTNLPDGNYTVDVNDDFNVLNGYWKSNGTNPGADNNSQVDPYTVTVSGGQINTTADFGYFIKPASVSNFVWQDDGDGIQEAGEPGIPGVIVTLTITWPNGTTTTVVDVTDANGEYFFGNLLLDEDHDGVGSGEPTFKIEVDTPTGYTSVPFHATTPDKDSDNGVIGTVFTPIKGQDDDTIDFGYKPIPTAVTVVNFKAEFDLANQVKVTWQTMDETLVSGYKLLRATSLEGEKSMVTPALIPATRLIEGNTYEFVDATVSSDTGYYYWLVRVMAPNNDEFLMEDVSPAFALVRNNKIYLPYTVR